MSRLFWHKIEDGNAWAGSATVCAAWLMATEGLTAARAIAAVQERHSRTDPNEGFRATLAAIELSPPDWWLEIIRTQARLTQ